MSLAVPAEPGDEGREPFRRAGDDGGEDGPVRVVETIWRPGLSRAAYEQLLRLIFEPVMEELAARDKADRERS